MPALALALPLLGACASPVSEYPSLAIRDGERVTGTMTPPPAQPYEPPAPGDQALRRADAAASEARAAHEAFLAAAPAVRDEVNAAGGTAVGSEAWSVAQVALADLQAHRSEALQALADLDRLYLEAATQGESLSRLEALRQEVEGLVEDETRLLDALLATLAP